MNTIRKLVAVLALGPLRLLAQSDSTGEEEAVVLSPFVVSADADSSYSAAASLAGGKVGSPVVDGLTGNFTPTVPITMVKKADAVVIQFVLSNQAEKQENRNRELYATVRAIQAAVQKVPGLRLEQREVRFASGNRKLLSFARSGPQLSYANVVIFADLVPELHLADRVKQVRDLLDRVSLSGETKLVDGTVGLYLKQPSSYRREILQKIFDDLDFVKKGLGAESEVRATGLNQQMRIRACSETEVELWIDYSFVIESVRELTNPKK
jgi:hypothetical protein